MVIASSDQATWAGHATVLLELGGARLLTDPVFGGRVAHLRRHAAKPAADLGTDLDAILISHLHPDHADRRSLRRLDPAVTVLCPPRASGFVRGLGFSDVRELAPGDRESVAGVEVTATEADHRHGRSPLTARASGAIGFLIDAGHRVYFAGDTDLFDAMRDLRPVDLALLPIAGWGTGLGTGHLNSERAARAASLVEARMVVPIHWGTFARLGLKRRRREALLTEPPRRFAAFAARIAPEVEVRVLGPGESVALPGPATA
jgi:L-ascorbate metabolism protein UlaG (beta-lactamase superfamily)